jgi:hypothetical protein
VLLRLWRFARPYQGKLLAGFLLMLASTGATLVPPYLTIPLMDEVLIPFQNGSRSTALRDAAAVGPAGRGAAGLGPGLGQDLHAGAGVRAHRRRPAHHHLEHLLGLSLDYFGAKRTGDLMARIGSETDRINVFLSLHALDFITDVLMIGMTSVILFSINPWLALVTLVPLPFIAWMIHTVRDRLRTGFEKIDRVWGEVTNVLADTIPGIRVVKAFAQEKREATAFASQPGQPGGQRQAQQDLEPVHAHGLAADRDRPAGGLGLRHLAGQQGPDHGGCADGLPRLHRPLLRPAGFDEPHRLGDAEGGGRRQAHLRHPGPRLQRARARQPVSAEGLRGGDDAAIGFRYGTARCCAAWT